VSEHFGALGPVPNKHSAGRGVVEDETAPGAQTGAEGLLVVLWCHLYQTSLTLHLSTHTEHPHCLAAALEGVSLRPGVCVCVESSWWRGWSKWNNDWLTGGKLYYTVYV